MSRKKVKTSLIGYRGPIFEIEGLEELNNIYDVVRELTADELKKICKTKNFIRMDRPTTEDGYEWFASLHFKTTEGEIAVLFPWSYDVEKKGGIQLDRSIAIYTKGNVSAIEVEGLLKRILLRFYEFRIEDLKLDLQGLP